MELWQVDVMGGIRLADGSQAKLVDGIDDHSRYCVLAKVVARATARPVCAAFAEALRAYGVPNEVLTDIHPEWCPIGLRGAAGCVGSVGSGTRPIPRRQRPEPPGWTSCPLIVVSGGAHAGEEQRAC